MPSFLFVGGLGRNLYTWIISTTPGIGLSVSNSPEPVVNGETRRSTLLGKMQQKTNGITVSLHISETMKLSLGLQLLRVICLHCIVALLRRTGTNSVVSQISDVVEEPAHKQPTSSSNGIMTNQVSVWAYAFMPAATMMMVMFQKWE